MDSSLVEFLYTYQPLTSTIYHLILVCLVFQRIPFELLTNLMYNTILNDSKREVDVFKKKIKQLETIVNSTHQQPQNLLLLKNLKAKVNGLESNLENKVDNLFQNIMSSEIKPQRLPDLSSNNKVRQRAISTTVCNSSFDKRPLLDDSSFLVKQQTLYNKKNTTRYQILNEYQDEVSKLKIDLKAYGRKSSEEPLYQKMERQKPKTNIILETSYQEHRKRLITSQNEKQFKFIIRDGQRIVSYELLNLKAQNQADWIFINGVIKKLEQLNRHYMCNYFFVDGRKILKLIHRDRLITLSDLLGCLINREDFACYFEHRLYNTPDGQERAATKIQTSYRAYKASKLYRKMKGINTKVRRIQQAIRGFLRRKRFRQVMQERNIRILEEFKARQQCFMNDWVPGQPIIEVHVSSLCYTEYTRLTMDKFLQRENAQISRIFRVKDPNLQVIYVTAVELDSEILGYYEKICQLCNIPYSNIRFLVPDNAHKFPNHLSLVQKLLFSPKTLKRIKALTQRRIAYIVPGYPSNEFVTLSHLLSLPLYSGLPQHHNLYSTKSGAQILFNKCQIPTSPGASEIYDEVEMINSLTVLLIKNQNIKIWVFKVDTQFNGRGIATINVDSFSGIHQFLSKHDVSEQQITIIKQLIKQQLPSRLKIAVKTLFRTYTEFLQSFLNYGGIIEAAPPCPLSEVISSSISFKISPQGVVDKVCSYDNHSYKPFVNILHTYPSRTQVDTLALIQHISNFLKSKKMIGYFTVNLLVFEKNIWAIGFECYLNVQTSAYFYYSLLNPTHSKVLTFAPWVHHPGLKKTLLKQFFTLCRIEQIQYLMEGQTGNTFLFVDIIQSQLLQLLSIGNDQQHSLRLLLDSVKLITSVGGNLNVSYGESIFQSRTDKYSIIDVKGAIKLLIDE